jgi:fatty-acid desaturase
VEDFIMNKQQLFSGLVGTVIALGFINTVSAGNQSWHYDASSDTVSYVFSGSDNHNSGDREYPATRQANVQSWQYDVSSDTVSYAFSGSDNHNSGDREYPATRQADVQSWQYDVSSDTIIYAGSGNRQRSSEQSADTDTRIAMDTDLS